MECCRPRSAIDHPERSKPLLTATPFKRSVDSPLECGRLSTSAGLLAEPLRRSRDLPASGRMLEVLPARAGGKVAGVHEHGGKGAGIRDDGPTCIARRGSLRLPVEPAVEAQVGGGYRTGAPSKQANARCQSAAKASARSDVGGHVPRQPLVRHSVLPDRG